MDSGITSGADLRGNCTNNNCHIGDGMNLLINRQLWPYEHYDASREFEARYADDYGMRTSFPGAEAVKARAGASRLQVQSEEQAAKPEKVSAPR
jgi:hypothetical protein